MFKKLKEIFREQKQPINLTDKNKQRFDSIISDNRFNFLEDIYKRLLSNDATLTDKEILDNYYRFSDSIQTNTIAAAELEWVTVSVICFYRPKLTEELIRRGLLCIVYSWGDNINSEHILDFIRERILAVNVEPYGGKPPETGMKWLTDILPTQQEVIQRIQEDVISQNRLELEQLG
jgi:hypothetical protein